jgi:hypothetical protein
VAPLVGVAADLGAILATHVALEHVDGRRLGASDDVERNCLMSVASEAADFEIAIAAFNASPSVGDGCAGPP